MNTNAIIDLTLDTDSEAEIQQTSVRHNPATYNEHYRPLPYASLWAAQQPHPGNDVFSGSRPRFWGQSAPQPTPFDRPHEVIPLTGMLNGRAKVYLPSHPPDRSVVAVATVATAATVAKPGTFVVRDQPSCLNCASDPDVTCDGEQPCSACSEPGFDCVYPGGEMRGRFSARNVKRTPTPLAHNGQVPSASGDHRGLRAQQRPEPEIHGSLPSTNKQGLWRQSYHHSDLRPEADTTEDDLEEESDFDDVDRTDIDSLEGVKSFLKVHESRLRTQRESLTRPLLVRAKRECTQSQGRSGPGDQTNPFNSLMTQVRSAQKGKSASMVQMRSHGSTTHKKWAAMTVPTVVTKRDPTILPKYKSIGRLGSTLLAPNSYVKKYLPYFADDLPEAVEKREEDIAKWYQTYQTDHDSMHRQRNCLERVHLWKPAVDQFVSNLEIQYKDVLWVVLANQIDVECQTCEKSIKKEKFGNRLSLIPKPDERSARRARLASEALEDIAEIHIWHVLVELDFVKQMMAAHEDSPEPSSTLCSICFLHNCMTHGAFDEPSEETSGTFAFMGGESGQRRPMMINDEERDVNQRMSVVVPRVERDDTHVCGIYCVDDTTPVKAILGSRPDGGIGGVYNRSTHVTRPTFENKEECGEQCFWHVSKRTRFSNVSQTKSFEPKISAEAKQLFKLSLKLHAANQRAPCMIAKDVVGLTCMDAFYYILTNTQNPMHFEKARLDAQEGALQKSSKPAQGIDTSMSSQLDDRPPFVPCQHDGPCYDNPDCPCSEDQVHCEYFCGCDLDCKRRFTGCLCAGKNRTCFNDDRCECWVQNRECDPWLCTSCGAVEVLDPANKYREDVRKGRCRNVNLQLELPAKTIKAPSEVQGWGLYAGQDLESHVFIGEYKGEIVSNQESDRRGSIYHHLGQEYLFVTNNEQQIDGSNFGNKTRFINNSQRNDYINVLAKKLLCYGVQRVMLYTKRPIKAGDELLYNYNYPDSVTKTFWERGEGPAKVSGAVVVKPALPTNSRIVKVADAEARTDPVSRNGVLATEQRPRLHTMDRPSGERDAHSSRSSSKRKRASDPDLVPAATGNHRPSHSASRVVGESDASGEDGPDLVLQDDSGDSSDGHSREGPNGGTLVRKRRIHPQDRRFGGNAQRKAWDTRKSRTRPDTD